MLKPQFAAFCESFRCSLYHYIRHKQGLGFYSFQPSHFQQIFGTKYGNENFVGLGRKPHYWTFFNLLVKVPPNPVRR